jgi:hypothetical protein
MRAIDYESRSEGLTWSSVGRQDEGGVPQLNAARPGHEAIVTFGFTSVGPSGAAVRIIGLTAERSPSRVAALSPIPKLHGSTTSFRCCECRIAMTTHPPNDQD